MKISAYNLTAKTTLRPQMVTGAVEGLSIDSKGFRRAVVYLEVGTASGIRPRLEVMVQESDDNIEWANVPEASFDVTGPDENLELTLDLRRRKRYIRAVAAATGTNPFFHTSCVFLMEPPTNWLWLLILIPLIAGLTYITLSIAKTPRITGTTCLDCHTEIAAKLALPTVHPPAQRRFCTICHTPHGEEVESGYLERLVESQRGLAIFNFLDRIRSRLRLSFKTLFLAHAEESTSASLGPTGAKPGKKSVFVSKFPAMCFRCHLEKKGELRLPSKMAPFEDGQCHLCHDPHGSEYLRLTRDKMPNLCFGCHDAIKGGPNGETTADYRKKPVRMGPFDNGDCLGCHFPHASNNSPLLRNRLPELCFDCHDELPMGPNFETTADYRNYPVKMEPFENGECSSCHLPHASDNPGLTKQAVPKLCFDCHDTLAMGPNDETTADYRARPVQMKPFEAGLCSSCHYPHASPDPRLLKASLENNEVCYMCHQETRDRYEDIGHNRVIREASSHQPEAGAGSCLNCHEHHSSNFIALAQKELIDLCYDCHGPTSPFSSLRQPRQYYSHPIGSSVNDPWHRNYLRCSSCHDPMGSPLEKLKRAGVTINFTDCLPGQVSATNCFDNRARGDTDFDALCLNCHSNEEPAFLYEKYLPDSWRLIHPEDSTGYFGETPPWSNR